MGTWIRCVWVFAVVMSLCSGGYGGDELFDQKCAACHTLGGGDRVGPDLQNVTSRRDAQWLKRWIMEPDAMIAEGDPIATQLLVAYNQVPMPNLGVTEAETEHLLQFLASQVKVGGHADGNKPLPAQAPVPLLSRMGEAQRGALFAFILATTLIVVVFVWVRRSSRESVPTIDMEAAYRVRRVLFMTALVVVVGILASTLPLVPYPGHGEQAQRVIYVTSRQFGFVFSDEPVLREQDLREVKTYDTVTVPRGTAVEFRVTSVDVTHGFGIYGPDGSIVAQTQAMPGYVNRLPVQFEESGVYPVLCLEYCGLAHHVMRSGFIVQ